MGIFKNIFGRKGNKKETEGTKTGVSEIEKIKEALESIRFDEIEKKVPEDRISAVDFARYKRSTVIMCAFLGKESVKKLSKYDTKEIADIMLYMVDRFDRALKTGNKDTADRFLEGLCYGAKSGYAEVKATDIDRVDEIIQKRIRRLEQYKAMCKHSMHVDTLKKSKSLKEKEYEMHLKNYEFLNEEIEEKKQTSPEVFERIEKTGAENVGVDDKEAYIIVTEMRQMSDLFKVLKCLELDMEILQNDIQATNKEISKMHADLVVGDFMFEV